MDDFVEIKTNKEIKNKVKSELRRYTDNFYWNIKFNVPLLMSSVNPETTNVTNEYGDLLQAKVFYIPYDNIICIEPQEKYADDIYYFLNISTGVCSENGHSLKNEIHIRFKLKNKKIAEIKTFKGEIKFKKIPLSLRLNLPYVRISTRFFRLGGKAGYEYRMPVLIMPYFILPFIICLIIYFLMPKYINYLIGYPICLVMIVFQIVITIIQYRGKRRKSILYYNKGVHFYNSRQLLDALDYFEEAYKIDSSNSSAKNAILKVNKYLN